VSWSPRKCGSLDVIQPYGPPRPVPGKTLKPICLQVIGYLQPDVNVTCSKTLLERSWMNTPESRDIFSSVLLSFGFIWIISWVIELPGVGSLTCVQNIQFYHRKYLLLTTDALTISFSVNSHKRFYAFSQCASNAAPGIEKRNIYAPPCIIHLEACHDLHLTRSSIRWNVTTAGIMYTVIKAPNCPSHSKY
jgi:hypothetical protein